MTQLDNARCFRATATTRLPDGTIYAGAIWERDGITFILHQNKPFAVEKGRHWDHWEIKRDFRHELISPTV
jgi:hypothetical protein